MYIELSTQTIEMVKEAIDRSNILRTKDDIVKDYQNAIDILKDINKAVEDEKIKYEEHIQELIDNN